MNRSGGSGPTHSPRGDATVQNENGTQDQDVLHSGTVIAQPLSNSLQNLTSHCLTRCRHSPHNLFIFIYLFILCIRHQGP